jgi:hypothetical protein
MLDTIIATFCILDDLLHILHHRNDPQAKTTDSEILTIAILACQEFGGNMRKALQWVKALHLFSFVPSESRFNRRLHRLMPLLHALAPPLRAVWEALQTCTAYALDTFPMPVCENIRANRCRIAPEKAFRGYRASHRDYFHGVKVHLLVASGGFIAAFWLTPGSWHDLTGLYGMALDIPCGCALMMDRGYTDYVAEDLLREAEGLEVYPVRRETSVRYAGCRQYLAVVKRRFVESVGSCLHSLLPRRVHAVTLDGFMLKLMCFIYAHNFNLLHKVAS